MKLFTLFLLLPTLALAAPPPTWPESVIAIVHHVDNEGGFAVAAPWTADEMYLQVILNPDEAWIEFTAIPWDNQLMDTWLEIGGNRDYCGSFWFDAADYDFVRIDKGTQCWAMLTVPEPGWMMGACFLMAMLSRRFR